MGYAVCGIIFIIIMSLYAMAKENLSAEKKESDRLKSHLKASEKDNSFAYDKIRELEVQRRKDLQSVIRYLVLDKTTESNPEELVDIIMEHLWYVGDISSVEDFLKYDFDYILTVIKYAQKGMLDVYNNYELYGDKCFRIAANGKHIFLTEKEVQKIHNRDYSSLSFFNRKK